MERRMSRKEIITIIKRELENNNCCIKSDNDDEILYYCDGYNLAVYPNWCSDKDIVIFIAGRNHQRLAYISWDQNDALIFGDNFYIGNSPMNDIFDSLVRTDKKRKEETENYLKPCPFCGGEGRVTHMSYGYNVCCDDNDCVMRAGAQSSSYPRDKCIERWNKRTDR